LQAVHWGAAARGLPASVTAIETVKRDVFSRQLSEGHISVVAECGSFFYNVKIQSKRQSKIDVFLKKKIFEKWLLACIIKCVRPVFDFLFLKKGNLLSVIEVITYYNVSKILTIDYHFK